MFIVISIFIALRIFMTMNTKKAYRMWRLNHKLSKPEMVEMAEALGIKLSPKVLDPRNQGALNRAGFWKNLRFRLDFELKRQVIVHLVETEELFVGAEVRSEIVTEIREDGFTSQDENGRKYGSHNILCMPFNLSDLPGEDPGGEEYWKQYELGAW